MDKRAVGVILAVGVALGLFLGVTWIAMQERPAEPAMVKAAAMPATVNLQATKWITQTGNTSTLNTSYYREATGYISSTVAAGYITYTWQSSPDGVVWFTFDAIAGGNASKLVTSTMDYFGPYVRLYWEAMAETSVTGTVWVSLKE